MINICLECLIEHDKPSKLCDKCRALSTAAFRKCISNWEGYILINVIRNNSLLTTYRTPTLVATIYRTPGSSHVNDFFFMRMQDILGFYFCTLCRRRSQVGEFIVFQHRPLCIRCVEELCGKFEPKAKYKASRKISFE